MQDEKWAFDWERYGYMINMLRKMKNWSQMRLVVEIKKLFPHSMIGYNLSAIERGDKIPRADEFIALNMFLFDGKALPMPNLIQCNVMVKLNDDKEIDDE